MYLLTMDKLWKKRKAPEPLDWSEMGQLGEESLINQSASVLIINDQCSVRAVKGGCRG